MGSSDQVVESRLEQTAAADHEPTSPPPFERERWNRPKSNPFRLLASFFSFFLSGMNDAVYGALLPYIQSYYGLNYTNVSFIFLAPFGGYTVAAFTNAMIHAHFGQRGVAIVAPALHIADYVITCLHPPFPVIVVAAFLGGLGNGLLDAAWSAWIGQMEKANIVQGVLHSMYSVGATICPLIATSMVTQLNMGWYEFFYLMVGASVFETVTLSLTFWKKTGIVYQQQTHGNSDTPTHEKTGNRRALMNKITWLCSSFFFFYLCIEVTMSGWVTSFMLNVRRASPYEAGLSSTLFWAGQTVGRAFLGPVTERYGERLCVSIYLALSIALELVFWLVPHFLASAIAVAFLGLFLGPMFPSATIMAAKLLPRHLHVSSLGFSIAIGGTGGAIGPFVVGPIAYARGVWVLQPIVLTLLGILAVLWLVFPRIKNEESDNTSTR